MGFKCRHWASDRIRDDRVSRREEGVGGQVHVGPVLSPCPRVYNTVNGKQKKCYKGSQGDEGSLLKVRSWGPQDEDCTQTPHVCRHKALMCLLPRWAT